MTESAAVYEVSTPVMTEKACPFCGGRNLSTGSWYIDDDAGHKLIKAGDRVEVPSIEFQDCLGSAPAEIWNLRVTEA